MSSRATYWFAGAMQLVLQPLILRHTPPQDEHLLRETNCLVAVRNQNISSVDKVYR